MRALVDTTHKVHSPLRGKVYSPSPVALPSIVLTGTLPPRSGGQMTQMSAVRGQRSGHETPSACHKHSCHCKPSTGPLSPPPPPWLYTSYSDRKFSFIITRDPHHCPRSTERTLILQICRHQQPYKVMFVCVLTGGKW